MSYIRDRRNVKICPDLYHIIAYLIITWYTNVTRWKDLVFNPHLYSITVFLMCTIFVFRLSISLILISYNNFSGHQYKSEKELDNIWEALMKSSKVMDFLWLAFLLQSFAIFSYRDSRYQCWEWYDFSNKIIRLNTINYDYLSI